MKKKEKPCPMFIIDTREQKPFVFTGVGEVIDLTVGTLKSGDYSIAGYEMDVAVERKSLEDAVMSMTWGRERFERELMRLSSFQRAAVVIEGSMQDVLDGAFRSQAAPQSIIGSCAAFFVDYGIPFIFANNPATAAYFTQKLLYQYWKRQELPKKKKEQT